MKTSIETNRVAILEKIARHLQNELGNDVRVSFGQWTDSTNKLSIDWGKFFDGVCGNGWMFEYCEFIEYNSSNEVVRISAPNTIKEKIGSELFDLITDRDAMDELYGK